MRLDLYLVKYHDVQSRNKSNELIKDKKVMVNGQIITKPSFAVPQYAKIDMLNIDLFVSRSAYKLKYFLEEISIDLKNKTALDIGSSTGGFTQILLMNNVRHVTCVDVGKNQLHERLRNNNKITIHENTNIKKFKSIEKFDIVTCDISFVSVSKILSFIDMLSFNKIIILFKPQYEVGKNIKRNKLGVVNDTKAIKKSKENFIFTSINLGWSLIYSNLSSIKGKNGNEEELFYFKKSNN